MAKQTEISNELSSPVLEMTYPHIVKFDKLNRTYQDTRILLAETIAMLANDKPSRGVKRKTFLRLVRDAKPRPRPDDKADCAIRDLVEMGLKVSKMPHNQDSIDSKQYRDFLDQGHRVLDLITETKFDNVNRKIA